jgi:ABC-type transport system involved in multi-copper enzyme maturation permease subunit
MIDNINNKLNKAITVLLILVGCSLVPWSFLAYMALFAFDAPGSENQLTTWLLVAPIWAYPLVAIGGLACAIMLRRRNRLRAALTAAIIPLAAIILWAIIMGLYFTLPPASV